MTETPLQLTKREIHAFFASRTALIATLAAGALLGLAGPFGTAELLGIAPGLLYWITVVVISYLSGSISYTLVFHTFPRPEWLAITLSSLITGTIVTAEIILLNLLFFATSPDILPLIGIVMPAAFIVTTASHLIRAQTPMEPPNSAPTLLDRLPFEKRGALVSICALDHYVEITTTKGREMILMRLADAIALTAPAQGLRIHRSHWVAQNQISNILKENGKTRIELKNGATYPVSRTYQSALKGLSLSND